MKRTFLLLVFACLALAPQAPAKKDFDRLQGTWEVVSFESAGQAAPAAKLKKRQLVFSGDKFALKGGDGEYEGTFLLDPTSKPKRMDTAVKGARTFKTRGIYELKEDTLKVCWTDEDAERPREFATKEGTKLRLLVAKRAK